MPIIDLLESLPPREKGCRVIIILTAHPSSVVCQFALLQTAGWLVKAFSQAGQHLPYSIRPTRSSPDFRSFLHNPLRYVLFCGHTDHPLLSRLASQSAWSHWLLSPANGNTFRNIFSASLYFIVLYHFLFYC